MISERVDYRVDNNKNQIDTYKVVLDNRELINEMSNMNRWNRK